MVWLPFIHVLFVCLAGWLVHVGMGIASRTSSTRKHSPSELPLQTPHQGFNQAAACLPGYRHLHSTTGCLCSVITFWNILFEKAIWQKNVVVCLVSAVLSTMKGEWAERRLQLCPRRLQSIAAGRPGRMLMFLGNTGTAVVMC